VKRPQYNEGWPESWKSSWRYDLEEVFGEISQRGYAYAYRNRRQRTLDLVREVLPPGARVLDIAGAQGNFSLALAELGYEVTWNDLRAELEGYVRLKHERGVIHYATGNAFELKFPSSFDAVLITEIIEHVAHPDEFLANGAHLVRPGGWIVMTTPNGAYFRSNLPRFSDCPDPSVYEAKQFGPNSDAHIFLLHPDEIEVLAERAGLVLERLELFTNPLTTGHVKTETLLRMLPKRIVRSLERLSTVLPEPLKRKLLVQMGARFRKPD
jgi:2-polyprenyl-3-methyl-5-hydroxy-6-metoxy-1,4-benzoquinol methylase